MKRFLRTTPAMATYATLVALLATPAAHASSIQDGADAARVEGMPADLFGVGGVLTDITNLFLFVAGALAVVMIIYGGLRYVISGGNSAAVTSAKNTILYAIVGLIVAFLAFAAVNFILSVLSGGTQTGWTNV